MDKTPKTALEEIEALIDQKIAAHERKFSFFGIITALVALVLGALIAR